ncbi:MAG: hypothetical protein BGP24_15355 [Lysobacterales bacterium 69-70]|nr:hypothetical protein [Xanthomonadaceae bacterium]ODU35536.1 MAG: hypothetical protein ABS97_03930 [Xanthomonadaceae bacterium SCN 69-320]ODV23008.1 MAG: hypothetical protein ABT27_00685 [Xanthomonadaceae bacterium SCN 69-25]OJY96680.1 MAG: hypothetical protein BGP24_15355 [Xanthomonadales bacterium 69-70]
MNIARRIVAFTLAVSLVSASGCASDPYVRWSRNEKAVESSEAAVRYAREAQTHYEEALSARARSESAVAASLITLSAIALGLGAAEAHRDAFVGVGLVGGTTFSLARWFENKPAELAYLAGVKAIDCAINAAVPFVYTESDRGALLDALGKLRSELPVANALAAKLDTTLKLAPASAAIDVQKAALAEAVAKLRRAQQLLRQGDVLLGDVNAIGRLLTETVDEIGNRVDVAVHDNLPALAALPALIQNLAASSAVVVPGLELRIDEKVLKPGDQQLTPQGLLRDDSTRPARIVSPSMLGDLLDRAARIEIYAMAVEVHLVRVDNKRSSAELKACGVDNLAVLSLNPASIEIESPAAEWKTEVRIRNGKSPYSARMRQSSGGGVTVNAPGPGASEFAVTVAKGTTGQFAVQVSDSAGHDIDLPVLVKAKAAVNRDTSDGTGSGDAAKARAAEDAQLRKIADGALAAGVTIDGKTIAFKPADVNGAQLKLSSDGYAALACSRESALIDAALLATDSTGKSLANRWRSVRGAKEDPRTRIELAGFKDVCAKG